jgi:hypothetical protein
MSPTSTQTPLHQWSIINSVDSVECAWQRLWARALFCFSISSSRSGPLQRQIVAQKLARYMKANAALQGSWLMASYCDQRHGYTFTLCEQLHNAMFEFTYPEWDWRCSFYETMPWYWTSEFEEFEWMEKEDAVCISSFVNDAVAFLVSIWHWLFRRYFEAPNISSFLLATWQMVSLILTCSNPHLECLRCRSLFL